MFSFMKFNEEDKLIFEALQANPKLKACLLEMLDIGGGKAFDNLKTGDEAEEAVVKVIQKTGQALLQDWVEKKTRKVEEAASQDESFRPHFKKKSDGNLL